MVAAMIPAAKAVPAFVLAASAAALAGALFAQYVLGLMPCILCITQRVPFAVAGLLAGVALLAPRFGRVLMALAGLAFLVNAGIAVYHTGVEKGLWASSCAGNSGAVDLADLAAAMSKPVEVRCDVPAWEWNGITMAGLNIVYSGGLALIVLLAARRMGRAQ